MRCEGTYIWHEGKPYTIALGPVIAIPLVRLDGWFIYNPTPHRCEKVAGHPDWCGPLTLLQADARPSDRVM